MKMCQQEKIKHYYKSIMHSSLRSEPLIVFSLAQKLNVHNSYKSTITHNCNV